MATEQDALQNNDQGKSDSTADTKTVDGAAPAATQDSTGNAGQAPAPVEDAADKENAAATDTNTQDQADLDQQVIDAEKKAADALTEEQVAAQKLADAQQNAENVKNNASKSKAKGAAAAAPAATETTTQAAPAAETPAPAATKSEETPAAVAETFSKEVKPDASPSPADDSTTKNYIIKNNTVHPYWLAAVRETVPAKADGQAGSITLALTPALYAKVARNIAQGNIVSRGEAFKIVEVKDKA